MTKFYSIGGYQRHRFARNIFLAILFFIGITGVADAQVSVTASAGTPGPTIYTTLKGAFDAINAGTHQGAIQISLVGNTTETAMAVLNSSSVPSSYTSVTIRPSGAGRVITGNLASAIIKLNGADSVTINGFVGAGPARDLTISNTSTSTSAAGIWVASASSTDGANLDVIQNCVVTGTGPTNTFFDIVQSSGTTMGSLAEAQNSNNSYINNAVTAAQYGIAAVGGNTNDVNNVMSNNVVGSGSTKFGAAGIFISQQTNVLISKNTITGVTSTSGTFTFQTSGIYVAGTISGGVIEKNTISDIKIASFWGCNGIQLNSTTASTNLTVVNNMIYDIAGGGWFDSDTIDDNGFGIAVNTGGGYKIWYNSIDLATNEPNAASFNPPTAGMWIGGGIAANTLDIRNNIFSNRETTGQQYAIYSNSPKTIFFAIDFNDYYSSGSVGFLSTTQATLCNWIIATSKDASSVSINPVYTSGSNLHLVNSPVASSSPLNHRGTPIGGITQDLDGDTRDASTPDIGADEFTAPGCAGNAAGTITACNQAFCGSGSVYLFATGFALGEGMSYQWQSSPDGVTWSNMAGQTNPLHATSGTIIATTYYRLTAQCGAGPVAGSSPLIITINNPAVTGTTPGSRCGVGTVVLGATGPGGSTLTWYPSLTGGSALGTGSPFTTPLITTTTTFYVSSTTVGSTSSGGKPNTAGADGGINSTDAGLLFDASVPFTILSVKMYPQAAGTITIQALTSVGTVIAFQNVTFAAAAPAGIVVNLAGFNIPAGINHRLVVSSNPSNISMWSDVNGVVFPYLLGTVGSITNGWLGGGAIAQYNYFYTWQVSTSSCESLRTPVTATVTTPPAVTIAPNPGTTICSGTSVTLTATSATDPGYVYTWNPGSIAGNVLTVTPANTSTYIVTANDGTCRNDVPITIGVNQTPSTLTVTPAAASTCPNSVITVTTSGGAIPGQTVFTETGDVFPLTKFTLTNSGAGAAVLNQNTTYFYQGGSSIHLTYDNNTNAYLTSVNIPLTGFTNPTFTYRQIAALEAFSTNHYDIVTLEYSLNSGGSWTAFPHSAYLGAGVTTNPAVISFDKTSYSDWNGQFTAGTSTPGTAPATSLWHPETIDLSTWGVGGAVGGPTGSPNFQIRFHLQTDFSIIYYGLLLDSMFIKGTGHGPTTWNPIANLYHNLAHTLPITSTTDTATTVYYWTPGPGNTAAVTYTATTSGGGTCVSTATTTLSATSAAPSVSITSNPAAPGPICSGQPVTFTAIPINGSSGAGFNWFINGVSVGGSVVAQTTFTVPNALHPAPLTGADQVYVKMSVPPNFCFPGGTIVPSTDSITMIVNPRPTANPITGGATVCNSSINTLTEVPTGTITTWQWYLNGNPVSTNPNTYGATLPGTYTIAVGTAQGCKDTSAPKIITLTTYTITATAGPNGTISPSGPIVVPCGSSQTFTITPNAGYSILDVTVNGTSVGPVGTYTISNVTADSTINATFNIPGCSNPALTTTVSSDSICAGSNYTLSGSITGGATTGTWSTSGTGFFSPSNAYPGATTYVPSPADRMSPSVQLTLTSATPGAPCLASTSTITLRIKKSPSVLVTGEIGICTVETSGHLHYLVADTVSTSEYIGNIQWYNGATLVPTSLYDSLNITATGNYHVTVTGNDGCTATSNVTVGIFPAPSVTSVSGTGPICTGSSVSLNANAVAGSGSLAANGYSWYIGGVLIPSATTSILSAGTPGAYTVTASNSNGCVSPVSSPAVNLAADNSPLAGFYTIGAGPATCTNYVSFATAINDLNIRGMSANCTFVINAGYTETVPAGGLKLGSVLLNSETVPSGGNLSISFQKSGAGANPLLTAFSGVTSTPALPNGIWSLNGVDNVTITQIDLAENALNSTAATMMEYGYGLFKLSASDGAQKNSIQNCTITLNKINSVAGTAPMTDGSEGIIVVNATSAAASTALTPSSFNGTSSNNKFYGNTVTNCHIGIGLNGYAAASPFTLVETGNDIGGAAPATGNFIYNFGNSGDATRPAAIRVNNEWGINISYNTLQNNDGAGTNTTNELRGIWMEAGTSANATATGNTITLTSGSTAGQTIVGIDNGIGSTAAFNTVLISNNTITASAASVLTAPMIGIQNTATATTVNIINNTVQNCSLAGTGTFTGILNSAVATSLAISSNSVKNNTKSSTGVMTLIAVGGPTNASVSSNIISGNTVTGGAAPVTFNGITGGTSNYVVDGNDIYNNSVTGMTGTSVATVYGYYNNSAPLQETIQDNKIHKLFVTGTSSGIHLIRGIFNNTSNNASHFRIVQRNRIDTLYTNSGSNAAITGIWSQVGFDVRILKNEINSLWPGQNGVAVSAAKGIIINSGTTVRVYNNSISLDLTQAFAPASTNVLTSAVSVAGIDHTSTTGSPTISLYYNTIRLAGGGGAGFGSSGIDQVAGVTGTLDMRNNLVANYMLPGAGGFTSAFRRPAGLTGYSSTSNNNLWYTLEDATHPIYYNGGAVATLAAFKLAVTPREALSIDDNPAFVSTAQNNLHLDPAANCNIDGGGTPIPSYTDDYDGDTRDAVLPDIGMDEFTGAGSGFTWKGLNTDWLNASNWCGGIPTVTSDVIIPAGKANYPVIVNGLPVAHNITINSGGSITINAPGTLSTTGSWTNNGMLTNNGLVMLNGVATQSFPGGTTGTIPAMTSLTVNNAAGAIINKPLVMTGVLKPVAGNIALTDTITLHSDASGTARVDTVQGSISYSGLGIFRIERYVSTGAIAPLRKAWRFLAAPIQPLAGSQTINQAWQEGQPAGSTVSTGYGMQIVGPSVSGPGFDLNNAIPSVKKYDIPTGTWITIPGTAGMISAQDGYMCYIRGDRGASTFGSNSTTTLRMAGRINTGDVTVSTANGNTNKYISVGNPYPSAIDFASASTVKTGLVDVYYLWDPKLGVNGGYQTFAGPGYVSPSAGPTTSYNGNRYIESGQAFFLYSNASVAPHSITIKENSKVSSNVQVARMGDVLKSFSTKLYLVTDSTANLFDGNRVDFDPSYSNAVDDNDANKLVNFGENFGLTRDGKSLAVERHAEIMNTDTVFYQMGQFRQLSYRLEFIPEQMAATGLTAVLEDAYLGTSTIISLDAPGSIDFNVNADAASGAADRFRIVFRQAHPVPVTFTTIHAERKDKDILVSWKVENELNISGYKVERSDNGQIFKEMTTQPATGNNTGGSSSYTWLDEQPLAGDNFYRIKSVGNNGELKYSEIVKVNMMQDPPRITAYPNPVQEDGAFHISMTNEPAGIYTLKFLSKTGQVVLSTSINHAGGNSVYDLSLRKSLAHGDYLVQILEGNKVKTTIKILY